MLSHIDLFRYKVIYIDSMVGSNCLHFTAWNKKKETDKAAHTQKKKNLFTTTSGSFVIVVRNNSFIDS